MVVDSEGFIYDKETCQYLTEDRKSFYKDNDYIYACKEGVFLIIDNRILANTGDIIAYIDTDRETSQRLQRINDEYYDNRIKVNFDKAYLTSRQIEISYN